MITIHIMPVDLSEGSLFEGDWLMLHPEATPDHLGLIPSFFSPLDDRPCREQVNDRYAYGGWQPQQGFTFNTKDSSLSYPGDPNLLPMACTKIRDELVFVYEYGYTAIVSAHDPNLIEVSRLD